MASINTLKILWLNTFKTLKNFLKLQIMNLNNRIHLTKYKKREMSSLKMHITLSLMRSGIIFSHIN